MHRISTTTCRQPRPKAPPAKPAPTEATPAWKPEPPALSRDEWRRIVLERLG